MTLIEQVRTALNNAVDNGYPIDELPTDALAYDLKRFDSALENEKICEISKAIRHVINTQN